MKKNILIYQALILCTIFFTIGFLWGKYGIEYFTKYLVKDNIKYYLRETNCVNLSGISYPIDSIVKEQATIMVFWSPTCSYCEHFFEKFKKLDSNVSLLGFPIHSNPKDVNSFITLHKVSCPQVFTMDSLNNIINPFHINATPTILLIDNKGNILYHHIGADLENDFIKKLQH